MVQEPPELKLRVRARHVGRRLGLADYFEGRRQVACEEVWVVAATSMWTVASESIVVKKQKEAARWRVHAADMALKRFDQANMLD
jgi:hypothetical protein